MPQAEGGSPLISKGPLDGIRILTFTQAWSGTFGTELLAFLGADVVQIEALRRVDIWRLLRPWVAKAILDESKTQHPENTQGVYNAVNLNKRGITLDLSTDEGKDIFWRMMPQFDVICENFRPGVLEGWGITLEMLAEKRSDVVLASISGYGVTGPFASYPANGATTEPMSGLASLHGYQGDPGMNTGGLYPDSISGYSMAAAIIAALARRDRVNGPQRIDVAMLEAMGVVVGDAITEYDATGRMPVPLGTTIASGPRTTSTPAPATMNGSQSRSVRTKNGKHSAVKWQPPTSPTIPALPTLPRANETIKRWTTSSPAWTKRQEASEIRAPPPRP